MSKMSAVTHEISEGFLPRMVPLQGLLPRILQVHFVHDSDVSSVEGTYALIILFVSRGKKKKCCNHSEYNTPPCLSLPQGVRRANGHQPPRPLLPREEPVCASFALRGGCFSSSSWFWGLPLVWYRGFDMYYRNDPSEYSLSVHLCVNSLCTTVCGVALVGLLLECC